MYKNKEIHSAQILIGKDTRGSGDMLESALVAGICSAGAEAVVACTLPTSAIAYLTRHSGYDAGVVISASHNTVEYNGIKFFNSNGYKLADEIEDRIENIIMNHSEEVPQPTGKKIGRRVRLKKAAQDYIDCVVESTDGSLDGLKVVLDCANGASSEVAPWIFKLLGAEVIPYYNMPDGNNINENCGSTHPEQLSRLVSELGADVGLAFDGDADRLIAVDEPVSYTHLDVYKRQHQRRRDSLQQQASRPGIHMGAAGNENRAVRRSDLFRGGNREGHF